MKNMLAQRDEFSKALGTVVSSSRDRQELLSSSYQRRVLGPAAETPQTEGLTTNGLLQLNKSMVGEQDQQLDTLLSIVSRQKEIGRRIGEELDDQNNLLRDMDERADIVSTKLKNASKSLKRL
jgi:regulator of vacuolar morphogenesis